MPAQIRINGVVGSNESAVDLDNLTSIVFDSPTTVGPYTWEFLDWPTGSEITQAWLVAGGGGGPASPTITLNNVGPNKLPDMSGTWLVKLTDGSDSTTDIVVCGVKSRRTALRVPAAGETTESSNTIFPNVGGAGAATNHRGWALTRDLGLKYLDDLVTSGSVQIFYLEDASIAAGISAGTPLALVHGASEVLFPGTAPAPYNVPVRVPKVKLAQADLHNAPPGDGYAYVGILKAGRGPITPAAAAPSDISFGYMTTSIPSGTFVWVTTSGIIQGHAAVAGPNPIASPATCSFAGYNLGDYVYVSGTAAGNIVRDSDTFAAGSTASDLMTPIGIVTENATPGSMLVLPTRYGGSEYDAAKTNMFRGIGDYSNIRVGRPSGAAAAGVAGEENGTIELVATAGENILINQVVCINTSGGGVMQAFVADSTYDPSVSANKRYGIFGIAVQAVNTSSLGHFTVFGEVTSVLLGGAAAAGDKLYVGSSTGGVANDAGDAVTLPRVDDGSYLQNSSQVIQLGIYDGTKLLMGTTNSPGDIHTVESTRSVVSGTININSELNTTRLKFDQGNVWRDNSSPTVQTLVGLPNTESDDVMSTTSIYEDTIKGSDLCDALVPATPTIGGSVWLTPPVGQPLQDMTAGCLTNNVWEGVNGGGVVPTNKLYGTFVLDDYRYYDEITPVHFTVHGYTDSATASSQVQIRLSARVNYLSSATIGPYTVQDSAPFNTGTVNINTAFSLEYFSQIAGSNEVFYVPKYDANGNPFRSIDIVLERTDTVDASVMIEKVVLQALYLNKEINEPFSFVPVVFEKKVPGYTLINTRGVPAFNVIDDSDVVVLAGNRILTPTIGSSMCPAAPRTVSDLVGFIPYDTRINQATNLDIKIIGKYIGTNPLSTAISLNLKTQEISSGINYAPAIPGAPAALTATPSAATGGVYAVVEFTHTMVLGGSAEGVRFEITRSSAAIADGGGNVVEDSFQISNVYVASQPVESYGMIESCYEDSMTLTNVIDAATDALNIGTLGDFTGFVFPGDLTPTEELYIPFKFDKRYDYRKNLSISIYGYVPAASAQEVELNLAISNFYDYFALSPQTGSVFTTLERSSASITGWLGAGNAYFIRHDFILSAEDIWNLRVQSSPMFNQFRNSGNGGLLLKLTRNDTSGAPVAYHATSARIYTDSSKKSSNTSPYVNISEKTADTQRSVLNIKSAYRGDVTVDTTSGEISNRTLLGSAHRYYFNFATNAVTSILNTASHELGPLGGNLPAAPATTAYGMLIPFNIAIIGVYGFADHNDAQGALNIELALDVVDTGGVVKNIDDGVVNMPLKTVSLRHGWRWTANPLNFNVPTATQDLQKIPLIYLPDVYSSTGWDAGPPPVPAAFAGPGWLLRCTVTNNSGGTVALSANVVVEAMVLPMHSILD